MALTQVIANLQRLSLHNGSQLNKQICSIAARNLIPKYCIHTTAVACRRLDNRLTPVYKEPSVRTNRWEKPTNFYKDVEYTVRPLPKPNTGGRGPNGRIWNHARGGGHKKNFRIIDWVRVRPESEQDLVEKVDSILYDPNRSARLALVAGGERKRYIIATQNMKSGDIIRSSRLVSQTAVRANEGDSYPVGSLPIGTLVNCLERFPDEGGLFARSAGVTAQLIRKTGDQCVLRLPSKREVCVSAKCAATVGRVSNIDHNKRKLGKAGRRRWLGFRPNSGRWHRKTGRFGRKIRAIRPMVVYTKPPPPKSEIYKMTFN